MARALAKATMLTDDARTRVTRFDFAPDAETGWHKHEMDYVIVPLTDCTMLLEEPGGERTATIPKGEAYTRLQGVEHNVINNSDAPMSFIEIELK